MAKVKFNWEVEMRYRNYAGEEEIVGVIGKFCSKGNAAFCAEAMNKAEIKHKSGIKYYYIVIEK